MVTGVVNGHHSCEALRRCVRCLCIAGIGDYLTMSNRGLEAAVGTSWGTQEGTSPRARFFCLENRTKFSPFVTKNMNFNMKYSCF